MNVSELDRIEGEALADEAAENPQAQPGAMVGELVQADLSEEFADFLDIMAKVASVGTGVQAIAARFNHGANVEISRAAIKLCGKYGIDARALLIGEDSTLGAWLGFGVAIAMPGLGVYGDVKALKAAKAAQDEKQGGENVKPSE